MDSTTFTYTPLKIGQSMQVRMELEDEQHKITIGDDYLGSMVQDDNAEFGWQTEDVLLLEELPELSVALKKQEAMQNLPYAL